jgi:hypothetical protein
MTRLWMKPWPSILSTCSLTASFACSASSGDGGSKRVSADTSDAPPLGLITDEPSPGSGEGSGFGDFGDLGARAGTPGSGCPTTLSGIALDPSGQLPLYNVVVYVPSEGLAPITRGASCETCDGNFSGRPMAAAVSDATGAFTLDITRVPLRTNIPLVIQAGKWRRQVTIAAAQDCANTTLAADQSRLPRNRAEGDLPRVAVMRAGSDALECLFTKIGVDPSEFTPGGENGSIELYYSAEANATAQTGQMMTAAGIAALPAVDTLFGDLASLRNYDMVLMSCEGGDERYDPPNLTHRENLQRYADEGGRLFGGHYHNGIIANGELPDDYPPFPPVIEFASGRQDITPKLFTAQVNTSFEKGEALADWLMAVGGSTAHGQIAIDDSERTVTGMLHESAVSWIDTTTADGNAALYYGFPTPVDAPACGRMVFTDVHLASGSGDSGKEVFPSCSTVLSPQQKALAFLIFDLANCVATTDEEPPPVPVIY